jgi:microcystin-dependent protein
MAQPYVAQILVVGFNFAPYNYAYCNGQLQSIAQNTALFSIVGTTYGGDGIQTFGLPNLQGRSVMNWGSGAGLSSYDIGQVSGVTSVTVSQAQMPNHNHTVYAYAGSTEDLGPTANGWLGEKSTPEQLFSNATTPDSVLNPSFVQAAGGSQPHENQQPFLTLNFCIALYGIFPSRN